MINLIFVFVFLLPHPHSATVFTENNPLIYSSVLQKLTRLRIRTIVERVLLIFLRDCRAEIVDLYSPRNDPDREMISNPEMIPN